MSDVEAAQYIQQQGPKLRACAAAVRRMSGALMALLAALVGCNLFVDPKSTGGTLVAITNVYHDRVSIVDVAARRLLGQRGDSLRAQGAPGISSDSSVLYYSGVVDGLRALSVLDVRRGPILLSRRTRSAGYPNPDGGGLVRLFAPALLSPLPSGDLLWYPTVENDRTGLAIYSAAADSLLRFLRIHLFTAHTQILRGLGVYPRGSLIIGGPRADVPRPEATELFVISPDLQIVDSIGLPLGSDVYDVAVSPDEKVAYVKTRTHLLKVDLAMRSVVASVPSSLQSSLALSPRGDMLLLTDAGFRLQLESSGAVYLYSSDLQPIGSIDLQPLAPGGPPPLTWEAVFSADGTEAYVTSGTTTITFGIGGQPAALFVVDVVNRRAVKRIHLWAGGGTPSIRMIK